MICILFYRTFSYLTLSLFQKEVNILTGTTLFFYIYKHAAHNTIVKITYYLRVHLYSSFRLKCKNI